MERIKFNQSKLKLVFIATFLSALLSCSTKETPPNIIFIMSDDHSVGAISAYGESLIKTPNIDKLASEGIRFNNCFNVVSLCGPSRAAILSGRYSVHNGYMRNGNKFNRELSSFPKLLQQAGYETAVIGKWHLTTQPAGFDYYNVIPFQGQFFDCKMKETGEEWQDGSKGGKVQEGYLTEVITDKAIGWLKGRKSDKPFCLLVHHKAPHEPYHYPKRYNSVLESQTIPEPENFYDEFAGKNKELIEGNMGYTKLQNITPYHFSEAHPDTLVRGTKEYKRWAFQHVIKGYHRLVAALDDNIGRLVDFIDNSGLNENTIVVYTSDNGWFLGDHGLFNKMWMYEESLKVPLVVRYPKETKGGLVSDNFVSILDFAATFIDYAGLEKPGEFQGESIKPLLQNKTPKDWRKEHFYHYFGQFGVPAHYGIRTDEFKLIHFYETENEPKWEFYDLKNDPKEMQNLFNSPEHEETFENFKERLSVLKTKCESN